MGAFFEAFQVDVWKLAFQVINFLILLYLLTRINRDESKIRERARAGGEPI